jgi:hypothetical protein
MALVKYLATDMTTVTFTSHLQQSDGGIKESVCRVLVQRRTRNAVIVDVARMEFGVGKETETLSVGHEDAQFIACCCIYISSTLVKLVADIHRSCQDLRRSGGEKSISRIPDLEIP